MDAELKDMLSARFDRLKPDNDGWQTLADAGVLGLPFSEIHGGLGLHPRKGFAVLETLGSRASSLPYLESVLLAGLLLDRSGGDLATQWLPRVAAGEAKLAFAWINGRDAARAEIREGQWHLSGSKMLVIGAAEADAVIITAETDDGAAAFLMQPESLMMPKSLILKTYPTIDGRRAADLLFKNVALEKNARLEITAADIAEILDIGAAAIVAEAAAIMARLVTDTRDYCAQREQFGQSLSRFQIIRHRLVDMYIEARRAAAAATLAANALELEPAKRAKAISAAKVTIADAGRFVGQNAVQLHGGIGMTEELPVSALFKRLTVIENEFDTRQVHFARYMALS